MKTNYLMIKELNENYRPERKGFINEKETNLILDTLCIKKMDNLALQNLRDFVVIFYKAEFNDAFIDNEQKLGMELMDKMSAICCVIDNEKWGRGMEV